MLYKVTATFGPYNKGEIVSFTPEQAQRHGRALEPYAILPPIEVEAYEDRQISVPPKDRMLRGPGRPRK